jgi:hypothetical protein
MQIQKYCIFSKSAIFIYIRTQAFAAHEILTSVISARNDLNRSRGTEPRQLIGLVSDNAHFNPTLLLLVKITDVNIS